LRWPARSAQRVQAASLPLGSAAHDGRPTILLAILVAALGYACGSLPVGVLVGAVDGRPRSADDRVGADRHHETRSGRSARAAAALVVLGDLLKGLLPVLVARLVGGGEPRSWRWSAATAALVGSVRSVFLAFGGGGAS
jgi:glycerol-3-phosphate acyltransferase PlsY